MKTKLAEWWKIGLFIAIIVSVLLAFVYAYLQLLGFLVSTALNSLEMLQSMVQAEATILGFLGVIAAYVLTSYDSRIDRLEQQCFDTEQRGLGTVTTNNTSQVEAIKKRMEKTRKLRKDAILSLGTSSIFLIVSLLLSITTLGTRNSILGGAGFYIFFGGISNLVSLFYQMSKETEEIQ